MIHLYKFDKNFICVFKICLYFCIQLYTEKRVLSFKTDCKNKKKF